MKKQPKNKKLGKFVAPLAGIAMGLAVLAGCCEDGAKNNEIPLNQKHDSMLDLNRNDHAGEFIRRTVARCGENCDHWAGPEPWDRAVTRQNHRDCVLSTLDNVLSHKNFQIGGLIRQDSTVGKVKSFSTEYVTVESGNNDYHRRLITLQGGFVSEPDGIRVFSIPFGFERGDRIQEKDEK